jgi:hypothetical protein
VALVPHPLVALVPHPPMPPMSLQQRKAVVTSLARTTPQKAKIKPKTVKQLPCITTVTVTVTVSSLATRVDLARLVHLALHLARLVHLALHLARLAHLALHLAIPTWCTHLVRLVHLVLPPTQWMILRQQTRKTMSRFVGLACFNGKYSMHGKYGKGSNQSYILFPTSESVSEVGELQLS